MLQLPAQEGRSVVPQLSWYVLTGFRLVALVCCWCFPGSFRKETILSIQLNNPIMHQDCSGQTVELTFEPEYQKELEDAARRVFLVAVPFTGFQLDHSRPI